MTKGPKDWNEVASRISEMEGKKREVNIAQIKEVLRCFCDLYCECFADITILLAKYMERRTKKMRGG